MVDPNLGLLSQDEPLTESETQVAIAGARDFLSLWKKRFLIAATAFVMSCASVYPFLYGNSLHLYWESFERYLLILSMALLLPVVICGGIAWTAWTSLRDLQKGRDPTLR